ncbi:hypothetical protein Pcinc_033438 [Petrolisthes cinctipes]|uniref:Uncharacterized protein n=1 Tax=Petrolisthes cinctipes TaxID=88211 RepID=A0AAE1ES96_PETCI|nr:hypothetical protein Pcinc_033438 [Petrolisthes cinctipes]
MSFEIEAGHVSGTAHVAHEALVVEMHGSDVSRHVFVGLERGAAVITGVVPAWTVCAEVVMVGALVVLCLVTHRTHKPSLTGVYNEVVTVRLGRLEAFTTVRTYILSLIGVYSHVSL